MVYICSIFLSLKLNIDFLVVDIIGRRLLSLIYVFKVEI